MTVRVRIRRRVPAGIHETLIKLPVGDPYIGFRFLAEFERRCGGPIQDPARDARWLAMRARWLAMKKADRRA